MDLTTIIGLVAGFGLILLGQAMEGGNMGQLVQITAALIVFGGTFGAVAVSFPQEELMAGVKHLNTVFFGNNVNFDKIIKELLGYATKARKEGVIALEKEARNASDSLMKTGLEAVSDGADPTLVRELMETQLSVLEEEIAGASKVWESAGGFAPTIGIIGAVLGLIQVMNNLSDPSKLGAGIAVAFVATIYGVASANIIFIPFATKIKFKSKKTFMAKQMMIEGILSIQAGESPALIERKLQAFISEAESKGNQGSGSAREANA